MTGTLFNGIYGYGTYGYAQYGIGGISISDDTINISDVLTVKVRKLRNITDSAAISDVLTVFMSKPEPNRIFINGNVLNGGIPKIINVTSATPQVKNITNGLPQFRRSLPYGY